MGEWAEAEFGAAQLGDRRLTQRLVQLATALSAALAVSLPEACRGWVETKAAYRFFDNPQADWRAILAPHWACSVERMAAQPRVLCLQDTTELDDTAQPGFAGLERLRHEARQGLYGIRRLAVTPEGAALGCWTPESGRAPPAAWRRSRRARAGAKVTLGWRNWPRRGRRPAWCTWPSARATSAR